MDVPTVNGYILASEKFIFSNTRFQSVLLKFCTISHHDLSLFLPFLSDKGRSITDVVPFLCTINNSWGRGASPTDCSFGF